jgi:hypothetical protein
MTRVDETHRPRRWLEFLQNNVEHTSPHRIGDLVGEHARQPDSGNSCIDSGLGGVDDEP